MTQLSDDLDLLRAAGRYERPPFDPERAALVVVDMVAWQVADEPIPGTIVTPHYVERVRDVVIPATRRVLAAARARKMPVAFLRVGSYRADFSDALPAFRHHFRMASAYEGQPSMEVLPELEAQPGELSLVKSGSGGFTTTGLHQHLQHMGVEHVLYTGVLTNACVMSTMSAGFDLGYHNYMVTDATATVSEAVQSMTEEMISIYMAELVDSGQAEKLIG